MVTYSYLRLIHASRFVRSCEGNDRRPQTHLRRVRGRRPIEGFAPRSTVVMDCFARHGKGSCRPKTCSITDFFKGRRTAAVRLREPRMNTIAPAFWSIDTTQILQQLETSIEGITSRCPGAARRYGANLLKAPKRSDVITLLLAQFKSPIILILFLATGLSFFLHDPVDAFIILSIVFASGLLGFWQEHGLQTPSRSPFNRSDQGGSIT